MFSAPLICSSSGVATVSAMVLGLAPGNWALTTTEGGTTSGYSEIGNWKIEIRPARKIATEMTPAKIGRSMKNRDRFIAVFPLKKSTGRHSSDGYFCPAPSGGADASPCVALTFGCGLTAH